MAKFLNTTGLSYHLEQLIGRADETLILISPYLKINDRLKQLLEDKDRMKIDLRLVYRENKLQPGENNWLKSMRSIRTSVCDGLHAKCYLNEKEAIVTSMNLYEFSQVNNDEMGIYMNKDEDKDLYTSVYEEARRLVRKSEEIKITVTKVPKDSETSKTSIFGSGFCIRCKTAINLNPMAPYCKQCYGSWKKFENDEYEEKYCHVCGKPNKSSLIKPGCYDCYKAKKDVLEFPLI